MALCLMLVVAAVAYGTEPLVLVREGQPRCDILIDEGASVSEHWAVEELCRFVREMSGAELGRAPMGDAAANDGGQAHLVIGRKTVERRYPEIKFDGLGTDGYVIKRQGNALIIAGGEQRGTLYGVYTLLEQFGCRWWTPSESTIPHLKDLSVGDIDLREVPMLEYRDMMYADLWGPPSVTLWRVRNKVNGFTEGSIPEQYGGQVQFEGSIIHSYRRLLERSKAFNYAGTSELWAWYKGKRDPTQPCLTHPAVVKAMTESVRQRIREHPEEAFVVVGQNDGGAYCQCDRCKALSDREGSPSALVLGLANEVADNIRPDFPHAMIMASAYAWSRKPPATMKPRDNVMIALSSTECDFGHPLATGQDEQSTAFRKDMEGWAQRTKRLYIWDYSTNFGEYLMPFPNLDVLTPNIKYYADKHATGYFAEGPPNGRGSEFVVLRMWVLPKAMWNPGADGSALIQEFLDGYYGPAAPALKRYIDTIHSTVRANPKMHIPCGGSTQLADQVYLAGPIIAEAEADLREAEQAVKGDPVLQRRVRHAHMPIWYVLARRGPGSSSWREVEAKLGTLHPAELSANLTLALNENNVNALAENDGGRMKSWSQWLDDWGKRAGTRTDAVPADLDGVDPATYRLIHGFQMSYPVAWATQEPSSTDGWVVAVKSHEWFARYRLTTGEDFIPGKRYALCVRVKVPQKTGSGLAFSCGLYSKGQAISRSFAASDVVDGQFQTFQIGTIEPKTGHLFWIATTKGGSIPEVQLDCFWLREVAGGNTLLGHATVWFAACGAAAGLVVRRRGGKPSFGRAAPLAANAVCP